MSCLYLLINYSVGYARILFEEFSKFIKEIYSTDYICREILSHHILTYKGTILNEYEYHLGVLSCFLRKWYDLGYSGIHQETNKLLNILKLKGNQRKGWAVLTMDPEEGPFTDLELHNIHHEVNSHFSNGKMGTRLYLLIWLFMALGMRPAQIADVKIKDFHSRENKHWINIPRGKQRQKRRRSSFTQRPLLKEISKILEVWILQVIEEGGRFAPNILGYNLPLFPNWGQRGEIEGFSYHSDGNNLSKEITDFFSRVKLRSPRCKEPLRVTPQRFRYTLGTRAAMEKQGLLTIAELLDHSDTQNVLVYTKATPEIVKILDEALGSVLGNLSKAFKGEIVLEDFDTGQPLDPTKLVRIPRLDPRQGGVGYCGTCVGCNANLPYLCYVCPNFKAWLEGPHGEVLKDLLDERNILLETTGDETIAFANDHLILAVAQIVDMCKEIQVAREGHNG
jgi:integrase